MKLYLAILVVGVAVICTQSKKPDFPWGLAKKHASKRSAAAHEFVGHIIQRKQTTDTERCSAELTRLECQSGIYADVVDISLNCGTNSVAERFARYCDKNEDGEYCGVFDRDSGYDAINNVRNECSTSSSSSCTMECTNALQRVRDNMGCCINTVFNTSSGFTQFDYSLWLECGVETVGECERTIAATPIHNDLVCDDNEVNQRILTAQCSAINNRILDGVRNIGGCDDYVDFLIDQCRVNAAGDFCIDQFTGPNDLDPGQSCVIGQQGCGSSCRTALDMARVEFGCCVNEIFNGTHSQDPTAAFLTSYALWNECGVETPPTSCRSLLGGSVGLMKALPNNSLITKLLFVLTFMVMTVWNL